MCCAYLINQMLILVHQRLAKGTGCQSLRHQGGRTGWDQVYGMIESVHAELEQMFWQATKLDVL